MLTNINPLFVKLINVLSQEANKIFNHPINKATFKVHFLKIKFDDIFYYYYKVFKIYFSKKVFHWVIRKKPNTEVQIKFELSFGLNKPVVNLGFPKDYTDYDDFSQTIRIEITDEFATSLKKGEMISVFWDKKNRCLKIIRF